MEKIDKIVFGDNQFFGINHRSQEKAEELLRKFSNIDNIFEYIDNIYESKVGDTDEQVKDDNNAQQQRKGY